MGVGAGLVVPNCLRWYWHRMTGYGYAAGAVAAMGVAFAIEAWNRAQGADALARFPEWQTFGLLCVASVVAIFTVSWLTPPVDPAVLSRFYRITRPFGWWGPQRAGLPVDQAEAVRREHRLELAAVVLAVPWQLVLFLLPMVALLRQWPLAAALSAALVLLSTGLYFTWYRELRAETGSPAAP
jgi:hypothetical protein